VVLPQRTTAAHLVSSISLRIQG